MAPPRGRELMLSRLVQHVRSHGLPSEPSLRRFSEELGTSHRMLTYYFGSRDSLLAEVLSAMRAQERDTLLSTAHNWSLRDAALAMWSYYTSPDKASEHQAFFYVFSLALREPAVFAEFLASLESWVDVTAALAVAEGDDDATAQRRAQLIVSAVRGLLIDRLTSSRPERVDAAFALLVDSLLPAVDAGRRPLGRRS